TYQLPIGRGRAFLTNAPRAVNAIFGDWDLSGIAVYTTGRPFSFTANSRYNHTYYGRTIPMLIAPVNFELSKTTNGDSPDVYFIGASDVDRKSTALNLFVSTYPGGPIARNQGRGPGFFNVDTTMQKSFNVS